MGFWNICRFVAFIFLEQEEQTVKKKRALFFTNVAEVSL
jgi:hypothetical protein